MTQPDFAKVFDVTKAMIVSYERAKSKPDDVFLTRLSKYTDIPKEDLLDTDIQEENINIDKLSKLFHRETVPRGTSQNFNNSYSDNKNYRDLYIESLREQVEFFRRNFEFSLKSIALATHSTNAQVKTLTWYQAYTQSGGDPKKTAQVLDTLNSKMAEYSAVGDEMGIAKNS